MAVVAARVAVSSTAVALAVADTDTRSGQTVFLCNSGGASVDVGPAGVTATDSTVSVLRMGA